MAEWIKWLGAHAGALSVFIPSITAVITAAFQYQRYLRQRLDENFRNVVEKLSSQNMEERLAAVANMGTFIKGKYYEETIDILINILSTELDYNVLNAIRGSLQKVKENKKEYKKVIGKLLNINRNLVLQGHPQETWRDNAKKELKDSETEYSEIEELFKENKLGVDKIRLDNLKEEIKRKWEISYDSEKGLRELDLRKQVHADFISIFLERTKSFPIKEGLKFYQNTLNGARIIGLNLSNSEFERSALASSRIEETTFDKSTIKDTVFTFSAFRESRFVNCNIITSLFNQVASLEGVSFSNSKFKDVFFAGSDLTGATFKGAQGLLPIYFYKAENIDKASFDDEFKTKLANELPEITKDEFTKYVNNSKLSDQRKGELFKTLDELKEPIKVE